MPPRSRPPKKPGDSRHRPQNGWRGKPGVLHARWLITSTTYHPMSFRVSIIMLSTSSMARKRSFHPHSPVNLLVAAPSHAHTCHMHRSAQAYKSGGFHVLPFLCKFGGGKCGLTVLLACWDRRYFAGSERWLTRPATAGALATSSLGSSGTMVKGSIDVKHEPNPALL